jgi:hypothetical protein
MPVFAFSARKVILLIFLHVDVDFLIMVQDEATFASSDFLREVIIAFNESAVVISILSPIDVTMEFLVVPEERMLEDGGFDVKFEHIAFFRIVANPSQTSRLVVELSYHGFGKAVSAIRMFGELKSVMIHMSVESLRMESSVLFS